MLFEIARLPGPKSLYRCNCGVQKVIARDDVRRGYAKSCGCQKATHGLVGTPTYAAWADVLRMVTDQESPSYPNYSGEGILIDGRWRKFEDFLADMGIRPDGLSLDRINAELGYCKANCHWASL